MLGQLVGRVPSTWKAGLGGQNDLHLHPGSPGVLSRPLNCSEPIFEMEIIKPTQSYWVDFTKEYLKQEHLGWLRVGRTSVKTCYFYLPIPKRCKAAGVQETRSHRDGFLYRGGGCDCYCVLTESWEAVAYCTNVLLILWVGEGLCPVTLSERVGCRAEHHRASRQVDL